MSKFDKSKSPEGRNLNCETLRTLLGSGTSVWLNNKQIGGPLEEYKNFRCLNKQKGGMVVAFERQQIEDKFHADYNSSPLYRKYDPKIFHVMANISLKAKFIHEGPSVSIEDPGLELSEEVNIASFKSNR